MRRDEDYWPTLHRHTVRVGVRDDVLDVRGIAPQDMVDLLQSAGATVLVEGPRELEARDGRAASLTAREEEIVARIGLGWSNADIASALYLSQNTIKSYVRSAYRKMGVQTRSQAVRWSMHHLAASSGSAQDG